MESLYRKYRPQTFAQVVGQRPVVETLRHAVENGQLSHAYLFCGPRGTGKTTLARLVAKTVVCEQGEHHMPDGICEQCIAVSEGRHPDVFELDAASRTGVDAVREEIVNRVDFSPVEARAKVYIIDEVHMLTTQAFNALLKTLEEPPAHVIFILCTTDPQKIPQTVLSRVQRFDFHSISQEEIKDHLAAIADKEGMSASEEALALIAQHAKGGMRDALSTLEQMAVFGAGVISAPAVRDLYGSSQQDDLHAMLKALATRNVAMLFELVANVVNEGQDLVLFTQDLVFALRNIYVLQAVGANPNVVSVSEDEQNKLLEDAQNYQSAQQVVRALFLLDTCVKEMKNSEQPRLILEVALAKLAQPALEVSYTALEERVSRLENEVDTGSAHQAIQAVATKQAVPVERKEDVNRSISVKQEAPSARQTSAKQNVADEPKKTSLSTSQASAHGASEAAAVNNVAADINTQWLLVIESLQQSKPAVASLLTGSEVSKVDASTLEIRVSNPSSFTFNTLQSPQTATLIEEAVAQVLGKKHVSYSTEPSTALPRPMPSQINSSYDSSAKELTYTVGGTKEEDDEAVAVLTATKEDQKVSSPTSTEEKSQKMPFATTEEKKDAKAPSHITVVIEEKYKEQNTPAMQSNDETLDDSLQSEEDLLASLRGVFGEGVQQVPADVVRGQLPEEEG